MEYNREEYVLLEFKYDLDTTKEEMTQAKSLTPCGRPSVYDVGLLSIYLNPYEIVIILPLGDDANTFIPSGRSTRSNH